MRSIWLVMKREIVVTLSKRSFWLMTFLMPVLLIALNVYAAIQENELGNVGRDDDTTVDNADDSGMDRTSVGLVDEAGLIVEVPEDFPPDMFIPFKDQITARAALETGEIEQYVYIPADYVAAGNVTVFARNFQIRSSGENMGLAFGSNNESALDTLLNINLVGDEKLITTLRNPVPGANAERHRLSPVEDDESRDQDLSPVIASVMPYLFYFVMIIGGGLMLQSVTAEKENRTVEVLLLSLKPGELMAGKILGLSVVTLVQMTIWLGGGALMLDQGAGMLNVATFTFPPGFIIWTMLFFLFGFLLYTSIMAAAGALAPTAREGAKVTMLLIIPLMPTLMFASVFYEDPHGTMSLVLSLFPLSAPSAMVTRLAVAQVPIWQPFISLTGVILTSYLMLQLAGRFFQAGNLLSAAPFQLRRILTGWRD